MLFFNHHRTIFDTKLCYLWWLRLKRMKTAFKNLRQNLKKSGCCFQVCFHWLAHAPGGDIVPLSRWLFLLYDVSSLLLCFRGIWCISLQERAHWKKSTLKMQITRKGQSEFPLHVPFLVNFIAQTPTRLGCASKKNRNSLTNNSSVYLKKSTDLIQVLSF